MQAILPFLATIAVCSAADVAKTPPMGFNTWNLYHCNTDAAILQATGDAFISSGLSKVGYEYVNTDDCWMLAARDANGSQVANPQKFPNGFQNVTAYLHGLGLKSGLYTAKGPHTCAGFAASCQHEVQDAAQWASWGIDYVKDDSCSNCRNDDNLDYHTMWLAMELTQRPMVLTVEGRPDDALISQGGYGNAKRVGHDISPTFGSMISLVDIGAPLWPFAHNSTNPTFGGWWNDLDMIEIGNKPDFACENDTASLYRCQIHYTQWCIMKAPLILGNDIPAASNATMGVLLNAEAVAVNQDALGVQAQRVSQAPNPAAPAALPHGHAAAVIARCDAAAPSQRWALREGGLLATRDAGGLEHCLGAVDGALTEGSWFGVACGSPLAARFAASRPRAGDGAVALALAGNSNATLSWNNGLWAAGPAPRTRHVLAAGGAEEAAGRGRWLLREGGALLAADRAAIVEYDAAGARSVPGGDFCLDLAPGQLETWCGPLAGGRVAVSLLNRSPAPANITVDFSQCNASQTNAVRDIWAAADRGSATASFTAEVDTIQAVFLVLTPA